AGAAAGGIRNLLFLARVHHAGNRAGNLLAGDGPFLELAAWAIAIESGAAGVTIGTLDLSAHRVRNLGDDIFAHLAANLIRNLGADAFTHITGARNLFGHAFPLPHLASANFRRQLPGNAHLADALLGLAGAGVEAALAASFIASHATAWLA